MTVALVNVSSLALPPSLSTSVSQSVSQSTRIAQHRSPVCDDRGYFPQQVDSRHVSLRRYVLFRFSFHQKTRSAHAFTQRTFTSPGPWPLIVRSGQLPGMLLLRARRRPRPNFVTRCDGYCVTVALRPHIQGCDRSRRRAIADPSIVRK